MKNTFKKTKKHFLIISVLLIAGIMLSMVSVSATEQATEESDTKTGKIYYKNDYYEKYKDACDRLTEGLLNMDGEVSLLDLNIPKEESRELVDVVTMGNPKVFYFNTYRKTIKGDYINTIEFTYNQTEEVVKEKWAKVEDKVQDLLNLVNDKMTDLEKAIVIHDYIVLNCTYFLSKMAIYDVLLEGKGNCQGYTDTFVYILSKLGIDSELVNSKDMNHQWCKICIDGKFYNVDLAWDDPSPDRIVYVNHGYFLRSDEAMSGEAGMHYDFDYCTFKANDKRFDDSLIHEIDTKFCYYDSAFYVMYNSATDKHKDQYYRKMLRYNVNTETVSEVKVFNNNWKYMDIGYWYGQFSCIDINNGVLYYNSPNQLLMYNIKKDKVFEYSVGEMTPVNEDITAIPSDYEYYGMTLKDGEMYVAMGNNPNEDFLMCYAGMYDEKPFIPGKIQTRVKPDGKKEQVLFGDVDLDGKVNVIDATLIQKYAAQLEKLDDIQLLAADVNNDGTINVLDCSDIQKYIAKLL